MAVSRLSFHNAGRNPGCVLCFLPGGCFLSCVVRAYPFPGIRDAVGMGEPDFDRFLYVSGRVVLLLVSEKTRFYLICFNGNIFIGKLFSCVIFCIFALGNIP